MKGLIRFLLSLSFLLLSFCSQLHAYALQKSPCIPPSAGVVENATSLYPEVFKKLRPTFRIPTSGIKKESSKINTTDDDDEEDEATVGLKKYSEPWNCFIAFLNAHTSEFDYSCVTKCHVVSKQLSFYLLPKYITLRVMRV